MTTCPGNTAPCKGCDMLIEWWTTPNQKAMPMSTPKDGVCPHCNRTFQQLARHMECKHKETA